VGMEKPKSSRRQKNVHNKVEIPESTLGKKRKSIAKLGDLIKLKRAQLDGDSQVTK